MISRFPAPLALSALIASADDRPQLRCLEFFAANIRNPNTRLAYARGIGELLGWCAHRDVSSIAAVQPLHVAAYCGSALIHNQRF